MAQEQAKQLLQQGIAASRGGQADVARQLFRQAARLDPRNEAAWQWLITVAEDNNERIFCLKQLLAINPQNERAREALQRLGAEATPPPAAAAPIAAAAAQQPPTPRPAAPTGISVPTLDETRYARLQQAADDFLRRYNPEPVDRLNVKWEQKQRGRYAEGGATRLRRVMYGMAALLVLVVAGSVFYVASQLDVSLGGDGGEEDIFSTRIPTATPRPGLTPMVGDVTPTPFPESLAVLATSVPTGLERGDPYELVTPTAIYPRVAPDVRFGVEQAVNYYAIGDYATALEMVRDEREKARPACYDTVVYYEALSLARMDSYRDAENAIQQALGESVQQGYTSCQDSPLLIAGLGEIAYLQDPQSESALAYSEQALSARLDPPLAQASLTKAQVQLARGNVTEARVTVSQALEDWPEDTNLLMLAVRIELADNRPQEALGYVGKALYVEPALLPALYLQAEVYLRLAEQAQSGELQSQNYALAALSAQTIQLYFPGDPAGYLYLAKARMGEEKDDLAETELNRVLAVEDSLPASAAPVIQEAHRLRGDLYYHQGRLEEARPDYDEIDQDDPVAAARLVEIYMQSGDYLRAGTQIDQLLLDDPTNETYSLLRAKLLVEVCTFYPAEVTCEYRDMQRMLTDEFIARLETDAQRADAYAYRAQAIYWDTEQRRTSLSEGDRQLAYQLALNDLNQALALREAPVDHYYRGLVLEALGQPVQAYDEYQWVLYWGDVYPYPFKDDEFEDRVARVAEIVQETIEAAAVTREATEEGPAGRTPTPSPSPTATPRPTSTPVPTATPAPEPTAIPPDEIP